MPQTQNHPHWKKREKTLSLLCAKDGDKVIQNNSLTAFGAPVDRFSQTADHFFFTGKPHIGEMGYAFLFRAYRPEQGKWQTSDPLGYPDGWNNFAYCNNWVIDYIDLLDAACIINRPLQQGGWGSYITYSVLGQDALLKYLELSPAHYAFLFTDTGNITGYPNYSGENRTDYAYTDYTYYDDDLLRKAIKNTDATGAWTEDQYQTFGHNCQTYISTVLSEYEKLFATLSDEDKQRISTEKEKIEEYWRNHFTKRLIDSKRAALE